MLLQFTPSIQEKLHELINLEGPLCLSMLIPATGLPPDPKTRKAFTGEMLREAYSQLQALYPAEAVTLIDNIDSFFKNAELEASPFALGIYASARVQHILNLPFPVTERLFIANHFDLRELLYAQQLADPYFLVLLDEKQARVLYGELDHLHEIMHRQIPPGAITTLDRLPGKRTRTAGISPMSTVFTNHAKERQEFVFQEIDRVLEDYTTESASIIVCGSKTVAVPFVNRTKYAEQITSVIYDNLTGKKDSELITALWPDIQSCFNEKLQKEQEAFEEKHGEGRALEGLKAIWTAVMEDRGETLLVEKNYMLPAFLDKHSNQLLYLTPPPVPYCAIPDAVGLLLEYALKKNLKLVLTENDMLLPYGHIGLITTY